MNIIKVFLFIAVINCKAESVIYDKDFELVMPDLLLQTLIPFAVDITGKIIPLPLEVKLDLNFDMSFLFMDLGINIDKLTIKEFDFKNVRIILRYKDSKSCILEVHVPKFELIIDHSIHFLGKHSGNLRINADEFVLNYEFSQIKNYRFNFINPSYSYKNLNLKFSGGIINFLYKFINSLSNINKLGIEIMINTVQEVINSVDLFEIKLLEYLNRAVFLTVKDQLSFELENKSSNTATLKSLLNIKLKSLDSSVIQTKSLLKNKIATSKEYFVIYLIQTFKLFNILNYEMKQVNNLNNLKFNNNLVSFKNPNFVNFNLDNNTMIFEYDLIVNNLDSTICEIKINNELKIKNIYNTIKGIYLSNCNDYNNDNILDFINRSFIIQNFSNYIRKLYEISDKIIN